MTGDLMLFAGMLSAPVAAMLCPSRFLFFWGVFPLVAVLEGHRAWFGRFAFLALPPFILMILAIKGGNDAAAAASLRWGCALASGSFFAVSLSAGGMAGVLQHLGASGLARVILLSGDTARRTRLAWMEYRSLPVAQRAARAVTQAVEGAVPVPVIRSGPGPASVSAAVLSWVLFLVSISGDLA
jgi:hypothetical protein